MDDQSMDDQSMDADSGKADSTMSTPGFHALVKKQIAEAMTAELEKEYLESTHLQASIDFTDLLGKSDGEFWWRLYINPKDWNKAISWAKEKHEGIVEDPEHLKPGYLYNYDKVGVRGSTKKDVKNFHDPMVSAYQKYFVGDALQDYLGAAPKQKLTHLEYIQLWTDARPEVHTDEAFERKKDEAGNFDGATKLADDVYEVSFDLGSQGLWDLAYNAPEDEKLPKDLQAFLLHFDGGVKNYPRGNTAQLEPGIDLVFGNFYAEMAKAETPQTQLKAIAGAVRSLHMFHAFNDGCGRCNVFTLLPLLLMKYGFGLPLGGKNGKSISRYAIHMMFNGGYSLDEMASYLFVTQDFGLQEFETSSIRLDE